MASDVQTNIIKNSKIFNVTNIVVVYNVAVSEATAQVAFDSNLVGGISNFPSLLRSLQITGDSVFTSNAYFKVSCEGVNIDNNAFGGVAAGSGGIEFVPTGTCYLVPAGSRLVVKVYNQTGTPSANFKMNVFVVFDLQDSNSV